jgi:hypothetical protein
MKTLELSEMESVQGGDFGCAFSVGLFAVSYIGLFALGPVTGGASWIALGAGVIGIMGGGASIGYSC